MANTATVALSSDGCSSNLSQISVIWGKSTLHSGRKAFWTKDAAGREGALANEVATGSSSGGSGGGGNGGACDMITAHHGTKSLDLAK